MHTDFSPAGRQVERAVAGTCVRGGFKGGGFNKYVIASCVCVATMLFAMLFQANYRILKPPPVKQPPTQVPKLEAGREWWDKGGRYYGQSPY